MSHDVPAEAVTAPCPVLGILRCPKNVGRHECFRDVMRTGERLTFILTQFSIFTLVLRKSKGAFILTKSKGALILTKSKGALILTNSKGALILKKLIYF